MGSAMLTLGAHNHVLSHSNILSPALFQKWRRQGLARELVKPKVMHFKMKGFHEFSAYSLVRRIVAVDKYSTSLRACVRVQVFIAACQALCKLLKMVCLQNECVMGIGIGKSVGTIWNKTSLYLLQGWLPDYLRELHISPGDQESFPWKKWPRGLSYSKEVKKYIYTWLHFY